MRGPKLNQKSIEVQPFREELLLNAGHSVGSRFQTLNSDLLKILGLNGLEHHDNPRNARPFDLEHHFLEVRGLGEVEWN